MATKKLKTSSLAEMKDKYIGKVRTTDRDKYENKLSLDILKKKFKTANSQYC